MYIYISIVVLSCMRTNRQGREQIGHSGACVRGGSKIGTRAHRCAYDASFPLCISTCYKHERNVCCQPSRAAFSALTFCAVLSQKKHIILPKRMNKKEEKGSRAARQTLWTVALVMYDPSLDGCDTTHKTDKAPMRDTKVS